MRVDLPQARQRSRWQIARTVACWVGSAVLFIGGLIAALSPASWPNDVASGLIGMLASPVFVPPLLGRLQTRVSALRPAWAPFLLWVVIGPIATVAGLPFRPSSERIDLMAGHAVADADRLIAAGSTFQASLVLSKYAPFRTSDPRVAAEFVKLAAAERRKEAATAPTAPAQPRGAQPKPGASVTGKINGDPSEIDARAELETIKALQAKMDDPTSLEVLGNKVVHETDAQGTPILRSYVEYRGSNAFGGTVTERAIVTLSVDATTVKSVVDATSTR